MTAFARRGTVVAAKEVHDAEPDGYRWSFAGMRRLKGVSGEVEVYRVRAPNRFRAQAYIGRCGPHRRSRAQGSARDRILDTAYDLFSRHGIRAVGVDRISPTPASRR